MFEIDVIIANKNNGNFLIQCIESVISQTLSPKEIIVVDDASTDDSISLLGPYVSSGKITLIQNQTSLGVAKCRNLGVMHGTGDYITTLDADDFYYDINKLSAEAQVIMHGGNNTIAFSDVMRVDMQSKKMWLFSDKRHLHEGDLSFHISHLKGFIPRDYIVSRKIFMEVGGYNSNLRIYEDWDLKIKLSKLCDWRFSGVIGTAYRNNPKGLSRSPKKEHILTMRSIFKENLNQNNSFIRAILLTRFFFYHSIYLGQPAI